MTLDTDGLELVSRKELPKFGTYWVKRPDGLTVPLPFLPWNESPIYALPNGSFLVDETQVLFEFDGEQIMMNSSMFPGEEETGGPQESEVIDTRRNYEKFMNQTFSVIDTNAAAQVDTNLYAACESFPEYTGTDPYLQIKAYGDDAVLIKASHFDYSAETARDFALLICDKVETPVWKNIDFLGASDSQDGWLVQGSVPNWKVTDAMYFKVVPRRL